MVVIGALSVAGAWFITRGGTPSTVQTAWARLDTEDVHSLAFVDGDPAHLLFGHHDGLLESIDGGRSWHPLATQADAMEMSPAADRSIVIAGHEVFTASTDGGETWRDIPADLPSLDIHGFARDPGDLQRMWAYPTSGGLWESHDGWTHWEQVIQDNIMFPVATTQDGQTILYGLDVSGLATSADGGRTWTPLTTPPAYPFTTFTATTDGGVLLVGSPDGIFRSADQGRSWSKLRFKGSAFAIAATSDGQNIAVVTRETDVFRSSDGGQTWPGPSAAP